ncbi:MAG: SpoIIE family protein phosphatase [Bacteroidia bacterium]|nr:SpoIIE family protein phosphatase [Bacteroidia bacterium]
MSNFWKSVSLVILKKNVIILIVFCFFITCNKKSGSKINLKKTSNEYIVAKPIVISIKDLPASDSTFQFTKQIIDNKVITTATLNNKGDFGGYSNIKHYTQENGLVMDAVSSIICDSKGYLWIGTIGGGVSKFDGKTFTTFSKNEGLPHNVISDIAETKDGRICFATDGGLSIYDGYSFKNFSVDNYLMRNEVIDIFLDKNDRIFCTNDEAGVFVVDHGSVKYILNQSMIKNYQVRSVFLDQDSVLWIGTSNSGILTLKNGKLSNLTEKFKLNRLNIKQIFQDSKGNIWISVWGEGLIKFDGKNYEKILFKDFIKTNFIRSIFEDSKGNLWMSSNNAGVILFDGKSYKNYTKDQGLATNEVRNICEDRNGSIWLATEGGGINRYDGNYFVNYTTREGLPDNVIWSITQSKNKDIYFATEGGGICIYDKLHFKVISSFADNIYSIFCDSKGNIWCGTEHNGFLVLSQNKVIKYNLNDNFSGSDIRYITEDKSGKIWFATDGEGLLTFDGKCFKKITTKNGLCGNSVFCILQDRKGRMWFGTLDNGVCMFDGEKFYHFNKNNGFPDNTIWCMEEDRFGNIWFGTNGNGIVRYDGKSFLKITLKEIKDQVYTQIKFTKENIMLLGTNFGLAVVTGMVSESDENLNNFSKKIFHVTAKSNSSLINFRPVVELYSMQTGFPVKDINTGQNTIFIDDDDALWLATGSYKTGLVRFDYKNIPRNKSPLHVEINSIKVNDEKISWFNLLKNFTDTTILKQNEQLFYGKTLTNDERKNIKNKFRGIHFRKIIPFTYLPESPEFSYDFNNIGFEFNGIELARPHMVRYKYKLEGLDNDWSNETDKNYINYSNLYEGDYTFKVMAKSPWGIWSSPVSYKFKILPPWYRTWWMYAAYVILFFGFIFMLLHLNSNRLKKRALYLKQKIDEATEELRKQNQIIESQKKLVEEKNKNILDSINYAKRIQQAILPSFTKWSEFLPDSFVLYLPKDIVAGDFYWMENVNQYIYVAAADCTGHGVPGAMVSVVCSNALTKAVLEEKLLQTDQILNRVRELVIEKLTNEENIRDGMDVCLIRIDKNKRIVQYSGANRPLYMLRMPLNDQNDTKATELVEFKPDKQPIGRYEDIKPFNKKDIGLNEISWIYLTTDGFADQIGGDKGKKIGTKQFKELLSKAGSYEADEQKEKLTAFFHQWKGNDEQMDDVTIIGIKI